MTDRARGRLRALAVALFLASAALGAVRFAKDPHGHAPGEEWLARARFLERARLLVPPGSAVLALTDEVPPPDYDFWLGPARPVAVLARVDPSRLAAFYAGREGPSAEHLDAHLAASGARLDDATLAAALGRAEWVLVDLAGAPPALPSARERLREGPRVLLRIERP